LTNHHAAICKKPFDALRPFASTGQLGRTSCLTPQGNFCHLRLVLVLRVRLTCRMSPQTRAVDWIRAVRSLRTVWQVSSTRCCNTWRKAPARPSNAYQAIEDVRILTSKAAKTRSTVPLTGTRLRISLTHQQESYTLDEGDPLPLTVRGQLHVLRRDKAVVLRPTSDRPEAARAST